MLVFQLCFILCSLLLSWSAAAAVEFIAPDGDVLAGSKTFQWTQPAMPVATRYRFALYKADDLDNPLVNVTPLQSEVDAGDGMNEYEIPDDILLQAGTLYAIWLRPDSTSGYGTWQSVEFTYRAIEFIAPAGGVLNTFTVFQWTKPVQNTATRYRFALYKADDLENPLVNETPLQSQIDAGNGINEYKVSNDVLNEDVLYSLFVRPDYQHGYGTWQNEKFYFTASVDFLAPAGEVLAGSTRFFKWTKPPTVAATRYRFALYKADDLDNPLVNVTPLQSQVDAGDGINEYEVTDVVLKENVSYALWLRPDSNHGYGTWQSTNFVYVNGSTLDDTIMVWSKGVSTPKEAPFAAGRNITADFRHGSPTVTISSATGLEHAVNNASQGTNIEIRGGTYNLSDPVEILADNIQLFARDGEKVTFHGNTKLLIKGQDTLVEGITFEEGSRLDFQREGIVISGDGCHIHKCEFREWGKGQYNQTSTSNRFGVAIEVRSNNVTVSNSLFTDMYGICIFQPQGYQADYVSTKHLRVHHNDFVDNPRRLGYAGEAVHIGTAYNSGQAAPGPAGLPYDDDMRQVFEYNLVEGHFAESELVSVKSSHNTIRYNVVSNSGSSVIVIRMGNWNAIYGNWFADSHATSVRISGESNLIAFNYFGCTPNLGASAITLMDRIKGHETDIDSIYWSADKNVVSHNIFEGSSYFIKNSNAADPHDFLADPSQNTLSGNLLLGFKQDSYADDSGMDFAGFVANENLVDNAELSSSVEDERVWLSTMNHISDFHSLSHSQHNWGAFDEGYFLAPSFWTVV